MTRVTQDHVAARVRDILRAARTLFAQKGFAATTMQEMAKAADLSAGAIYRHYPSKDDLIRAVCDLALAENRRLFAGSDQADRPAAAVLGGVAKAMADGLRRAEGPLQALCDLQATLAAARDPGGLGVGWKRTTQAQVETVEAHLERGQREGGIRTDADPRQLALALSAPAKGVVQLFVGLQGEVDPEPVFEAFLQLLSPGQEGSAAAS